MKIEYHDEMTDFTREDWDKLIERIKNRGITGFSWRYGHPMPAKKSTIWQHYCESRKRNEVSISNLVW